MTRNGKIARLPRAIRDELNRRLDDNEPGVCLVEWLNGLPEVKQALASYFQGRPAHQQGQPYEMEEGRLSRLATPDETKSWPFSHQTIQPANAG